MMHRYGPTTTLILSCLCLGLAPLVMPHSYSLVEHGVSESAAQAVPNAWLARIGFLVLGAAVVWLAALRRKQWQQPGTAFLALFGFAMVGVGVFSARSWEADRVFSAGQDRLHSVFANIVGASFVLGLAAVLIAGRKTGTRPTTTSDLAVLAIAVMIPLAGALPIWGVLQRVMFAGAYVWFGTEALAHSRGD